MDTTSKTSGTAATLVQAALHLFGQKGYEGTSIRAIANHANTNVASIAYHFGGKAGLYRACVETVVTTVSGALTGATPPPLPQTPEDARQELRMSLRAFASLILSADNASDIVAFVTRELADPGEGTDRLFEALFLPSHTRFCRLWSIATGQPAESEAVKLAVFSLVGQVVYFRLAQPFVLRRMGWTRPGQKETAQILDTVLDNLESSLERNMQ